MHVSFSQHLLVRFLLRATAGLLLLIPAVANAQSPLRTELVATGLQRPVGFVQDPSDPATQYIPQHGGRIRVLRNGRLQGADFLDLSGAIVNSGESLRPRVVSIRARWPLTSPIASAGVRSSTMATAVLRSAAALR